MAGIAGGSGAAHDATIRVENTPEALEAAAAAARQAREDAWYVHHVERLSAKVEKLRDHLAHAEAALADAERELADHQAASAAEAEE